MSDLITCEDCRGRGYNDGFVERVDRSQSGFGRIKCASCGGAGTLTPERAEFLALCEQFREKRDATGHTIVRVARHLETTAREVSALENGRRTVDDVRAALAKLESLEPFDEAASNERLRTVTECLVANTSPCCKTPLDLSRVIPNGRYKGHGIKRCRTCGMEVSRS